MVQAPKNVQIIVEKNTAVIKFQKDKGAVRTEIDKFWVNGEDTYDSYTGLESFYFENLDWGTEYKFKLRSYSSAGEIAETGIYSFKIEDEIIPTVASNVNIKVDKNVVTIKFKKGDGVRTYIDKFWVNGEGTLDEYTTGDGFYLEGLPWGLEGKFKLITMSNTGSSISSEVYSFKIEDEIIPTVPTDVRMSIYRNNAEIHFKKGNALYTKLDKFWVNGEGTWDEFTKNDEVFYLDNLKWGEIYNFKLRSEGNTGLVADTEVFTFKIDDEIIPTAPTDIVVSKFKNNAEIHFKKGTAIRTMLDLGNDGNFEDYTVNDEVFYLGGLNWGQHYEFKLRSMGNTGLYADSPVISFDIDKAIGPKLPDNVSIERDLNTVVIRMSGQEGIRTEIAKSWYGGLDRFEEYTTGDTFFYDGLDWGGHYEFKLKSISNTGETLTSAIYSFDIVSNPAPVAPTNIVQEIKDGAVTIRFTKGNGVKTEIDASWIGSEGSWDSYTTGDSFYFEGIPYNSKLHYKLRTVSVGGQTAESQLITFYTPIQ